MQFINREVAIVAPAFLFLAATVYIRISNLAKRAVPQGHALGGGDSRNREHATSFFGTDAPGIPDTPVYM